ERFIGRTHMSHRLYGLMFVEYRKSFRIIELMDYRMISEYRKSFRTIE
ncbi:10328_t:CDS:1, partial [Funneliformis mosseae]